ncbi:MAG: hypothetical protein JNG86_18610, partial [Verrucomicrobiaceae bacterium]|nr:hypothetical protein [Verrucomicrobiaceae bacterium]
NNRQVAGINVGGSITNTGAVATLRMAGPVSSVFTGTLNGTIKLQKAGTGTFTIDGYRASTPDSGMNTFTGGTDIYGVGTTGGINLDNTNYGLGGANGSTPGDVNLYSGTLGLLFSNTTTAINGTHGQHFSNQVVKFGAEAGLGLNVNLRGPALINVNQGSVSVTGQGNIMQIGALNMSNATLTLTGGNLYRLRVAGTTTLQGSQAAFQTNSDGPSGVVELTGLVTGGGTLTKLGDGTMRGIILSNPANNYAGGTNIIGGDVQVTTPGATTLGTGAVRVFPTGTLRLAGNGSVDGSKLEVMSGITQLGAVVLDDNFNPTVLTPSNFSSVYNTTLQIGQPYWTQPLNMAAIGDGRAFLGTGISQDPTRYMAATLGAGAEDAWNPGVGVYRIVGGVNNLAFEGANNVFTGNSFLQIGPQRGMVVGGLTNGGNAVFIRNSNNYTGGTQVAEGIVLISETGGSPLGETPLGSGAVEVYGEYRIQGALGSAWNAASSAATNAINLRPAGLVRIFDTTGYLAAGDQGRWGDAVGVDLNGGQFSYNGAGNWQSVEQIGDVTVRKGGILTVTRSNATNVSSSSAALNIGALNRVDRGSLTLNYNTGFLGVNSSTPDSFERLTTTTVLALGGNTANGTGAANGIVSPWIIDRVTNSFVGYNAATGFQPVGTTVALAGGSTVAGSPTVTVTSTTGMRVGMVVSGTGIPAGATVSAILSATQFTLNQNATAAATAQTYTTAPAAGELAYNKNVIGALTAGGLVAGDIADISTAAKTLADNPTLYALRSNQNINPAAGNTTMTLTSGGLILTGGTINLTGAITPGVVSPMTLNFGAAGAGEALIYVGAATSTIQAQIAAAQGLTKMGPNQLNIQSINPGIGAPVVINEGTLLGRVPVSGSGSPVSGVFNNQDIILNGGALVIPSNLANAAGTASEIASNISVTGTLGGNIFVRGDATIGNNGITQYTRVGNLTIANDPGAPAMNGNGVIALVLQSGIWVAGTTTLSPQARINGTFNGFSQSTFAGQVTGVGGVIEKFGNGAITMLNGTNNYTGGTIIHGAGAATASSTVASGFRGTGTPFGSGSITINPGGQLRLADNANIASNFVTLKSDDFSLGGISVAHNGPLPSITTSNTPSAGQVKVESSGPFAGVIGLDYGYYSQPLNVGALPGGDWWIGNSQQAEAFYFNSTLGTAASGKYLIGGGGNQNGVNFGSVLVSAGRTTVFENLFTGGTPGQVKIEVGAQTGDFAWNAPAFINGNSGFMVLSTRNTGLTGDVRVNTSTVLTIGNSFALGTGRLIVNGGGIRSDFGNNNHANGVVSINNNIVLQGDYNAASGGDLVIRGNLALSDVGGAGATRTFNINTGTTAIRGVVSGAAGSNLLKIGAGSIILNSANTYEGYTQITAGNAYIVGDVKPNLAGPLGVSDSPVLLSGGVLRAAGRLEIARDLIVTANSTLDTAVHDRTLVSGGISIAPTFTLTLGSAGIDNATFRGGQIVLAGAISGGGAVTLGTTAAAPGISGTISITGNANGYGINTYAGGTTLQTARVQIGADTYFTGPAGNPLIISGPLGTGAITLAAGEGNRGGTIEAIGGARTIVNAFAPISVANNTSHTFTGHEALTFTRDLNISSDNTLRNRTFAVQNLQQPVTFSGILSASGTAGVNFIKTGPGKLILTGANTFATSATTGLQISQGIVQVSADNNLGAGTSVRLNGGVLSAAETFSTARQLILQANSGLDVAAGKTLTLTAATTGAFGITKSGPGTLALNSTANTLNGLQIGGVAQLKPEVGYLGAGGGVVSTNVTSGTPFGVGGTAALTGGATTPGSTTVTVSSTTGLFPGMLVTGSGIPAGSVITSVVNATTLVLSTPATATATGLSLSAVGGVSLNGGALALVGGGTAQALTVPNLFYAANGAIALLQGTTSSQLTVSTNFSRLGAFNGVSYGTLTLAPSALANLGVTEKLIVTTGAPANTAGTGGDILTTPSIFVRLAVPNSDANFARYEAGNGIREHSVTTIGTLAATASGNVADITAADVAGAGNIDIQALRTIANITPTDGTTLVRLARGGLIFNGNAGADISAPVLFGTGAGASLTEAIVYAREGQAVASSLSGGVTARDFTKTGPGALALGGTANFLNSNAVRLPVLSVQDGTLRLASLAANFQNQLRGTTLGDYLGHYALNVNERGVFDLNGLNVPVGALTGNGTVSSGVAGNATLTVKNGFGVDTTFNGLISNGSGTVGLTKTQNGVLTLAGHGTYTGGTTVEAGRVTNAIGSTAVLGRLEAQTVTALGNGPITLTGGYLRFNSANLLGAAQSISEVGMGVDYLQYGTGSGYNVTISNTAATNGVALPANVTSTLGAATNNAGINNLIVNAPLVTAIEGVIQVNGTSTFSQANTVLRTAGGRLFLAGQILAAGNTLTKTGANDLVITNSASGLGQNQVGLWKIYGGVVEARTTNGSSNPFGVNPIVEVNVGTTADARGVRFYTDGDGTSLGERITTYANTTLRVGSLLGVSSNEFVSSG